MIEPTASHPWLYRGLLLVLVGAAMFARLLPLGQGQGGWPGPEVILCLVFAWALRRPDYVPLPLVAAIFLADDMMFLRPPGLWTALVVLGLEFLRAREPLSRELPFVVEWGMVAVVTGTMVLANQVVLTVFVVNGISFGQAVMQLMVTLAAYPLVVLVSVFIFGVRKIQPGEEDAMRRQT